ncbi:MAG: putative addiction module antidote protein, partial [Candidatus Latescibacterota bacterium]
MIKVFIGGSRNITNLTDELRTRIDRIIENRYPILIGDANGADKAVQQYLKNRQYDLVEIFFIEGYCRNNVGNWPERAIPAPDGKKDFKYYEAKDKVMAEEASIGLMIWDGKSLGTLMNACRLIDKQKKVVMYVAPRKEYITLQTNDDLEKL